MLNRVEPQEAGASSGLGMMLAALAAVLGETTQRLESISGRVSQTVLNYGDPDNHGLIVVLQDFDRVQQELAALGDMILRCAAVADAGGGSPDVASALDAITISDVRSRLLTRMHRADGSCEVSLVGTEQVY